MPAHERCSLLSQKCAALLQTWSNLADTLVSQAELLEQTAFDWGRSVENSRYVELMEPRRKVTLDACRLWYRQVCCRFEDCLSAAQHLAILMYQPPDAGQAAPQLMEESPLGRVTATVYCSTYPTALQGA